MKERILYIAIRQMKTGGYDKLNFASIAEELDVSRANLHHHFKNKEGLGLAATETYIEEYKASLDEAIAKHDGDIRAFLGCIEDHLIHVFEESKNGNACIGSQLLHDSQAPENLRKIVLKFFQREIEIVEIQLTKARDKGDLKSSTDIKALTFKIASVMHGIGQMGFITSDAGAVTSHIKGSLTSLLT